MATVPTFPTFPANDASLTRLQQLAAAVTFTVKAPVIFHLYKTGNQSVAANTQTAVQWDAASADTDTGWSVSNKTRYTAQTPGYFHCDFGVNCAASGVDGAFQLGLRLTTGANNPGGAGNVSYIAMVNGDLGTAAAQESLATSAGTPYLYILDYLEVVVLCTNATTITAGWNNSGNNDLGGFPDGSPSFTGTLVSLGP